MYYIRSCYSHPFTPHQMIHGILHHFLTQPYCVTYNFRSTKWRFTLMYDKNRESGPE